MIGVSLGDAGPRWHEREIADCGQLSDPFPCAEGFWASDTMCRTCEVGNLADQGASAPTDYWDMCGLPTDPASWQPATDRSLGAQGDVWGEKWPLNLACDVDHAGHLKWGRPPTFAVLAGIVVGFDEAGRLREVGAKKE